MPEESKPVWTDQEVGQLIAQARTWIDVKWRHQGRSRNGVDCVGLFVAVGQEIGKPDAIPSNYTRNPDTQLLKAELKKRLDEILIREMRPGDIVQMRFEDVKGKIRDQHVALITDRGVLHAAAMYRKVTEHSFDEEWRGRVEHAYRFRRAMA